MQYKVSPGHVGISNPGLLDETSALLINKESVHALQAFHAAFTDLIRSAFPLEINLREVVLSSLEMTTPERHLARHTASGYQLHFSLGHAGAGTLECTSELAWLLVDYLLSGEGELAHGGEPLSDLSTHLLSGVLTPVISAYGEHWKNWTPAALRVNERVTEYQPGEAIYTADYELRFPERSGHLCFVLRMAAWSEALSTLSAGTMSLEEPDPNLLGSIGSCQIIGKVILGTSHMTVREVLSLHVGDIICLEQTADDSLEIRINGHPKLRGEVQVQDGQYIYLLRERITHKAY